jgi:hypothetical protein
VSDRDWNKELAKVDKQLASLSDEQLLGPPPAAPVKGAAPAAPAPAAAAAPPAKPPKPGTSGFGVYARLILAMAVGVSMWFWPYDARCGLGLIGYLAAVGVMTLGGIWSSIWTWRHRAGRAHVLSNLIVLWGLTLGSLEILPRIGYAKPDAKHLATWTCP